jgi:Protein of unknown function, DUF488
MIHAQTPTLFERQKRLLAVLGALGGTVGDLDFQKLLFLYCWESGSQPPYEFVPHKFGAFSFTSYADRCKLVERGFLENDERTWKLTAAGQVAADAAGRAAQALVTFSRRYRGLRGDALVADTYRRHAYYATRSEIAQRVLDGDTAALAGIEAARPRAGRAGVSTIGYESRTLEGYLNELLGAGVTMLCDVRRNPLSRKYGFSKGTLAKGCESVGIRYEHLPQLGIASDERRGLVTQADYDALFAHYEYESLPLQGAALATIQGWVGEGARVALTCYERLPSQCHRHCVAEALERRFGPLLSPTHL